MKILLVKPYWRIARQIISPPMGVMYLASYVRKYLEPTPEVYLIEQAAGQLSIDEVERRMLEIKPDVVGITSLTYEADGAKVIAEISKKHFPNVPVLVGGPHATVFYDHVLENSKIDIAAQGEGEATFLELCQRFQAGADWKDVLGIAYKKEDGTIVKNPARPAIMDLDTIPFPAWDLIDIPIYYNYGDMNDFIKKPPYMPIFTSRACPFGCIYCHQLFGTKFRARSVENTLEEIRVLTRQHGVNELQVIDDIFNWDLDRAKNICRGIINEGIKVNISFPNGIRGDRLDDELIELLVQAGCFSMTFAVETATPRLQKLLHKYADLDKIKHAIDKVYDLGIIPMGFYMLGFPTETPEEIEATIKFACETKMLKANFFSVVPFPRTRLEELFKETYPNEFKQEDRSLEKMHYFTHDAFYKRLTGVDLEAVVRRAYRKFYLDPVRIYRIMTRFTWNIRLLRGMYHGVRAIWAGGSKIEEVWSKFVRKRMGMTKVERGN